jgi:hypothetical protein
MAEQRRVSRPMARRFGPRPVSYTPAMMGMGPTMMGPAMMAPASECPPQTSVAPAPAQVEAAPAAPEAPQQAAVAVETQQ